MSSTIPADDPKLYPCPATPRWNIGIDKVRAKRFRHPIDSDIWTLKFRGVCHGSNAPDAEEELRAIFDDAVKAMRDPEHECYARGATSIFLECNFLPVLQAGRALWGDDVEVTPCKPAAQFRGLLGQVRRVMWFSMPYAWEPEVVEDVDPEKAIVLTPNWAAYAKDLEIPALAAMLPQTLGLVRDGEQWAVVNLTPGNTGLMFRDQSVYGVLRQLNMWTEVESVKWSGVRRRFHPIRDCNTRVMDDWRRRMLYSGNSWAY